MDSMLWHSALRKPSWAEPTEQHFIYSVRVQNTWQELYDQNLSVEIFMDSSAGKIMGARRENGRVRHL